VTELVLKSDALGSVERVDGPTGPFVRRRTRGGVRGWIARRLLARERAALRALAGVPGVARLCEAAPRADVLERAWIEGAALSQAAALPRDFFERLEELVRALHERGVCHNDLHKEGNVLVGADGYPALVDFQLASVHRRRGRTFAVRAREDLRHVWKHRSFYCRALGVPDPLQGAAPPRAALSEFWRRFGKPLYRRLKESRRVRSSPRLGALFESGEARRGKDGPWPRWSAPVGPRSGA